MPKAPNPVAKPSPGTGAGKGSGKVDKAPGAKTPGKDTWSKDWSKDNWSKDWSKDNWSKDSWKGEHLSPCQQTRMRKSPCACFAGGANKKKWKGGY